ncbi:MAG: tetratricopeptide repeat protein [Rhodospirillaceae bacterium]|nr:tetratricopeptide repeat protein [Rhodospirillaceae bacterium]
MRLSLGLSIVAIVIAMTAAAARAQSPGDAAMARGLEARKANDFAAAEASFREAIRLEPRRAEGRHMLGLVLGFQGRYDEALAALAEAVQLAPQDTDIALSVARVNAWASRFAVAERGVDAVLATAPNRQDAWTLKGRIAFYQGQYGRAREAFDRAQALGPADIDLLLGFGDVARAQGREAEAMEFFRRAAVLDPASADVNSRLAREEKPDANPWRLTVVGGKSWLSRSTAPDWTAAGVTLERLLSARTRAFAGVDYARRFRLNDAMLRAGFATRAGAWDVTLEGGVTPADDVLPEYQLNGTLAATVRDGDDAWGATRFTLDGQLRHYPVGTIHTVSPGLDQTFADGRIGVNLRWINTFDANDDHLSGWAARVSIQAGDRVALQAGYGVAPEADRGLVRDTKALSGAVLVDLTDTIRWRVDIVRETREGSYRRVEVTSGFTLAF